MTGQMESGFFCMLRTRLMLAVFGVAMVWVAVSPAMAQDVQLDTPVSDAVMQKLQQAARNSLNVAVLPKHNSLKPIQGSPVNTNTDQPIVLYMGADYCPYCAAIRWPLVVALMRFGEFADIKYMRSSHDDVYADTVTFSFHDTSYVSDYVQFASVELQDREGKRLEQPNQRQIDIFRKFDMPPYTPSAGGIPFLYLDGQYMQSGSPFNPAILKSQTWADVAAALDQPESPIRRAIIGTANVYTVAICRLTDGQPRSVCNAKAVTAAAQKMADAAG